MRTAGFAIRILTTAKENSYHFVNEMIRQSNGLLHTIFNSDPVAQLLESIPGIGMFLAVLIRAEIDEIRRFSSAKKLLALMPDWLRPLIPVAAGPGTAS